MQNNEMVQGYLKSLNLLNRKLDLEFLSDVVARHVATFAFSSVGCWLGDNLSLDLESLYNRIVVHRRGGYCFEQNGLLYGLLKELGFSVSLYLARVIYNQDIHPGLTHRITMVEYEGERYVLDVGFGPLGPRIPVLISEKECQDGEKIFRIAEGRAGEYHMQVLQKGGFFSLYRFELARYGQSDCELGHFYSHRHPDAAFVNNLVAALILESETRSLRNTEYWVTQQSGTQIQKISSSEQLWRILVGDLGIQITEKEGFRLYERLNASAA
nr:arylamine N-acetyltransferase [uncultured Desulfobacter sp.]